MIREAMRRGDLSSFASIEQSVLAREALVWLATDGETIAAAAVTETAITEWRKVLTVVACGGKGMPQWLWLLDGIEAHAKADGCQAVRIMGRKGWQRMLPHYRTKRIILERAL